MASIKGITIEIAGKTSGLVDSLKQADKALSDTRSALKAVDKALELDPSNVELLAQKEELLANAVSATEERLTALKEAAELAKKGMEDGTATREQYAQLTAEIAMTEKSLEDLKSGGDSAGKSLEESGEAAEESGEKFKAFGAAVGVAAQAAAAALAAIGAAAIAAGKALIDCTVGAAEFADEILTMSSVTGVSTTTLQEWSYAAELVDVSVDTMTGALTRTTRALGQVAEGNSGTIEMFDRLGVSAYDASGNLRSSEDVFYDLVDALGGIENETERDALAMELLGKSAQDLNPLIEAGSDTLRSLGEEAQAVGYVMDEDTLGAFGEFDDTLNRLSLGTTAAKNALGGILLPVLNSLAGDGVDLLSEFTNAIYDANGDIGQMGEAMADIVTQIVDVVMENLPLLIDLASSIIGALAEGIINNLDVILASAIDIIFQLANGITEALPKLAPVAVQLVLQLVDFLLANLPPLIDAAVQIVLAVAQGIGEALPDLIPAIVQCIDTIVTTLLGHTDEILACGIQLIAALILGIVGAIPDILSTIVDLGATLLEQLGSIWETLADSASTWGADLIDGFISAISAGFNRLRETVSNAAQIVADYLHFSVPDKGPLSDFDESGGDLIDVFDKGIKDNLGELEAVMNLTANTVANGLDPQPDYSGVLSNISDGVTAMGGQIIIPVYIGNEQIDTLVVNAANRNNYVSGAR